MCINILQLWFNHASQKLIKKNTYCIIANYKNKSTYVEAKQQKEGCQSLYQKMNKYYDAGNSIEPMQ